MLLRGSMDQRGPVKSLTNMKLPKNVASANMGLQYGLTQAPMLENSAESAALAVVSVHARSAASSAVLSSDIRSGALPGAHAKPPRPSSVFDDDG